MTPYLQRVYSLYLNILLKQAKLLQKDHYQKAQIEFIKISFQCALNPKSIKIQNEFFNSSL